MKEKLTLQDLVDLLAKKTGMTKKEADAFFREFFAVITDNIFNNEPVKIKDFGTFKLTSINSRESVDVNTGEKIEIPAHSKLSFLPDKSLKTLVNKPFELFPTELAKEGVNFGSIEISEEPAESPEDEDTGIDEVDFIENKSDDKNDTTVETPSLEKEEEKADTEIAGKEKDTVEKTVITESSKNEVKQTSFVYTYKEEQSNLGDSEPITMRIPNEQLVLEVRKAIDNITPSVPNIVGLNHFSETDTSEYEAESDIPLDINKVHEKINQLKDAIDALSIPKTQQYNNTSEETLTQSSSENINPDKAEEGDKAELENINNLTSINSDVKQEETTEATSDNNSAVDETLDKDLSANPLDEYDPYYNEDRDSIWYKIRHRLPVIIFTLITIIVGAYLFSKLFEQKNTYETYYHNISDGFNNKTLDENIKDDNSALVANENDTTSLSNTDDPAVSTAVDSSFLNSSEYEISGNLKIKNPNKASNALKQRAADKAEAENNKFPLEEKITPGASLRLISKKHYGYNAFWVYIYQENKGVLKNYDDLTIGKTIIIPNLKKYGVDINDPQAIKTAKEIEQRLFTGER